MFVRMRCLLEKYFSRSTRQKKEFLLFIFDTLIFASFVPSLEWKTPVSCASRRFREFFFGAFGACFREFEQIAKSGQQLKTHPTTPVFSMSHRSIDTSLEITPPRYKST